MQLTLIRNATLIIDYARHRLLVDPFFAPKHAAPSFAGISENPTVDLPRSPESIMDGVELLLVSHLHGDHFGPVAQHMLPKALPLYCQPGDETTIAEAGFTAVTPLVDSITWEGITITRTGGHHGVGPVETPMGSVIGFVLAAPGEPTIYLAGDTVMVDEVRAAVETHRPEVIVTHSGGATLAGRLRVDLCRGVVCGPARTVRRRYDPVYHHLRKPVAALAAGFWGIFTLQCTEGCNSAARSCVICHS